MDREFDIIVWGATGYTGRRIVKDLVTSYIAKDDLKVAVAGRSIEKLRQVCVEAGAPDMPMIVADSADKSAVDALAKRAKVIIAAAGPYALFGTSMVAACADAGTDYVDLTGEKVWVREMIDRHEETARASGARIVHACGFDCIPFDYGVMYTQKLAQEAFGAPAQEVLGRIKRMKVAPSGGSVATAFELVGGAAKDEKIRSLMKDPFVLAPDSDAQRAEQPDADTPRFDPEIGKWAVSFAMSPMNMAIVHRSNMMMGYPYGQDFKYNEMFTVKKRGQARIRHIVQEIAIPMLAFPPIKALLKNFVLPKQGEGGSEAELDKGHFELWFVARGPGGKFIHTSVSGDTDPGYVGTPLMIIESAVSLLKETTRDVTPGGIYSPAAAFKEPFFERLKAGVDMRFQQLS